MLIIFRARRTALVRKTQDKILINYILGEIIDVFQETLIIANDPIDYMQSDKISITKDFKSNF